LLTLQFYSSAFDFTLTLLDFQHILTDLVEDLVLLVGHHLVELLLELQQLHCRLAIGHALSDRLSRRLYSKEEGLYMASRGQQRPASRPNR
jgi:hypothetical protein